jgi:photosystem II stability/assembly factor-like uncharacterized protein
MRAPAIAVVLIAIALPTGAGRRTEPGFALVRDRRPPLRTGQAYARSYQTSITPFVPSPVDASLLSAFRWRHIGPVGGAGTPAVGTQADARAASRWQVTTDRAFPYRVCGARDGDLAVCAASRGDRGRLTVRDWSPVGTTAAAFVAPDPVDSDIVYTSGALLARFDRRTGQAQDVSPPRPVDSPAPARAPIVFSPVDPKTLYYGARSLWRTSTAGQTWIEVPGSPPQSGAAAPAGAPREPGTIAAIAPSYVDQRAIWIAGADGTVQLTRDGGASWTTVEIAARGAAVVAGIEPSHFDPAGAYVALEEAGAGALATAAPRLLRTRNAGASWTEIAALPGARAVHAVREDSFRRGLLFAATDEGVFISFDDGDEWQPLRLNMPAIAVHDLAIHDGDLVAAAADGGFWILDDLTPLRQITPDLSRAEAFLFRPGTAWRFRGGALPAAEGDRSSADNPADGVVISYLLRGAAATAPDAAAAAPVRIEIIDTGSGETIRRIASDDPGVTLPATAGLHRVVWDGRYAPPPVPPALASAAPRGMFAHPGTYQLRLTVGSRVVRQPISVRLDPRVRVQAADVLLQFKLSKAVDAMLRQVAAARAAAAARGDTAAVARLDAVAAPLVDLLVALQRADAKPTDAAQAAVTAALDRAQAAIDKSR